MTVEFQKTDDGFETQHGKLGNPPSDLIESNEQVEETGKRFKRRVIDLNQEDREELEGQLDHIIQDWMDSRSGLEDQLRARNDLFEGVTEQTDFPWPGASNVHIPLAKIKAREIAATVNRSTMRPVPFLNTRYAGPASLYDESKSFVRDLENFLEDKIKNDTNVHQTLKDSIFPIFRDGTCPVQFIWETNYEMVTDWKLYDDPTEFEKDYPDAEAAGISGKEYRRIIELLGSGGKYEAEYEYLVPTYDGPKGYLVPLIDFVHWPTFVPRIADMACHGKSMWYTDYQLKEKVRCGMFDKEDVDEILSMRGEERTDGLTSARDSIDGISRSGGTAKAQEYRIFELCLLTQLTQADRDSNTSRKYLIYYHHTKKKVLRVEHYPIRKGKTSYFALRFLKRDNRFLGISLTDDMSDLSMEIDTIHRQRTNSRTITHVPSFKAKFTAKSVFDPSRKEFRFRPGVTFYMSDVNDVAQFDIRPVDLSGSIEDEMLLYQLVDMVTGSSSGLSGQSNPLDPRAPARKQQEMLRQSSNRIDDYVGNLLGDFEDIGQHIIDLYYQFAPDRISYYATEEDGMIVQKEIDRSKLFDPNVKFKVNGTSVFINPEMEFGRMQEIYAITANDPITQGNPRIRRNALERLLMSARIDDEKSFLPNQQELPQAFQTDEQAKREADAAKQKEKLAAKTADMAAKHKQALELEEKRAEDMARQTILENVLPAMMGQPAAGAPGAPAPAAPAEMPMGGGPIVP